MQDVQDSFYTHALSAQPWIVKDGPGEDVVNFNHSCRIRQDHSHSQRHSLRLSFLILGNRLGHQMNLLTMLVGVISLPFHFHYTQWLYFFGCCRPGHAESADVAVLDCLPKLFHMFRDIAGHVPRSSRNNLAVLHNRLIGEQALDYWC